MDIGERDWVITVILAVTSVTTSLVWLSKGGIVPLELAVIFGLGTVSTLELGWESFRNFR